MVAATTILHFIGNSGKMKGEETSYEKSIDKSAKN